ncbi:hypothetical protein [Gordonia sp. N1V]|uniref:hypothetical protein n=1 Tax=Gordonia sp. N1V TaxID=3034163 RepID=UPI0023E14632|nr:hypothetical protein [Gordonia sp. N1V]MDF3284987.1 hypothetical protein [Gordonia sp. N1V]
MTTAGRPRRYTDDDVARWRRLLDEEGWTLRSLAEHVGVSDSTIKRRVGRRDVRTGPPEYDITPDEAVAEYEAAGSEEAAAKTFGVSRSVIRRRLYLAGLRDTDFHNR